MNWSPAIVNIPLIKKKSQQGLHTKVQLLAQSKVEQTSAADERGKDVPFDEFSLKFTWDTSKDYYICICVYKTLYSLSVQESNCH